MPVNKRATTNWEDANRAFILYQDYLTNKADRFALSATDLMFISNFKGGNASVSGTTSEITQKLEPYSGVLEKIERTFGDRSLSSLSNQEIDSLVALCVESFAILDANRIKGFSHSYLSALLCAYFTALLPILDRWIVANLGIPHKKDSQGQIKDLQQHYPEVIRRFHRRLSQEQGLSVREFDKLLFIERPD